MNTHQPRSLGFFNRSCVTIHVTMADQARSDGFGKSVRMAGGRVLVVDDDADSRMLMAELLTFEGYRVATASNGREALNQLSAEAPSVILLDLEMPVMDGRSFRQRQLQMPGPLRSVPVIVCSGSDEATKLTAELQAFACLSKPLPDFDPFAGTR
jgi:CheY-like chemotaxis protein